MQPSGMTEIRTVRLGESFYLRKIAQIQEHLDKARLDGLLLLEPHNVIYASGFFHIPSERPLGLYVPVGGSPALFVPLLERENATDTWITDIRVYFEYPGEEHPVLWMVRTCGARRLAVDSLAYRLFEQVKAAVEDVIIMPLIEQMRWVKEPEELALIEQAARYADYCLSYVSDHAADVIRSGGTELDVLNACLSATAAKMQRELGDIFDLRGGSIVGTVHSGPRASLPHGRPLERVPQPGETLIAGIGAMVGGYHAESGATFILGEPTADQLHCLKAAAACNDATIAALRTGTSCTVVNEAALQALRDAGLGDAIRHRIGHGMGLQGHEAPWLAPGDQTPLVPGMVFSNEPGIYRPGRDGYRTINTMIVTEGEARVPSCFLAQHPLETRLIAL